MTRKVEINEELNSLATEYALVSMMLAEDVDVNKDPALLEIKQDMLILETELKDL